ncbi:uncharacterized protein FFC1_12564 [Fusarium fujikuroi]|nr:uncharacterized protein FFC1_12564 [Fusarium fujikuroi]
MPELECCYH